MHTELHQEEVFSSVTDSMMEAGRAGVKGTISGYNSECFMCVLCVGQGLQSGRTRISWHS